jgi:hypothetical protein
MKIRVDFVDNLWLFIDILKTERITRKYDKRRKLIWILGKNEKFKNTMKKFQKSVWNKDELVKIVDFVWKKYNNSTCGIQLLLNSLEYINFNTILANISNYVSYSLNNLVSCEQTKSYSICYGSESIQKMFGKFLRTIKLENLQILKTNNFQEYKKN